MFIATERTRELMLEHRIGERLPPQLARLEERLAGEMDEAERGPAEELLAEGRHLLAALPGLRRVYPDVTFERRLTLRGSGRRAEVLCLGGGHTASDAFVHLPDDRVALMGDLLLVGVPPLTVHGDAREWRRIVAEVRALDVERFVPGHGPVCGPAELAPLDDHLALAAAPAG